MKGTFISIDPSINTTGYAVFTDGELIRSGVIRTPDIPGYMRVAHIMKEMWSIALKSTAAGRGYSKTALVIEVPDSFSYQRSQRNGRSLNQGSLQKLNWVIGGLYALSGVWANAGTIYSVTPRQWKGNRNKEWDQIATGIKQKDESDAVALGQWWCRVGNVMTVNENYTSTRR
ncbi:MAG: hypothetical protein IT393_07195 [Nitrospirae bacterium]|nr:hypothetical protein [Nitrospirota bacterium]